jgi:rhodanese-related sulfurtransferase
MLRKKSIFILSAAIVLGGFLALNELEPSIAADDQPKEALTTGEVRAEFTTLTSTQLAVMLRQKDFYFVNVHTPYEGEIKNTDAFIVYDKIGENLDKLPRHKNEKIVLYCQSGRMSEIAARELARLGYSQVSHLEGGMITWKKSGYEVIRK